MVGITIVNKGQAMAKISFKDYLDMSGNPDTTDEQMLKYSLIVQGEGGFSFDLVPNPKYVEVDPEQLADENAMKIANNFCRMRRRSTFNKRVKDGVDLPVIVSEGDSWFQFPLLVKEVVDNLKDDYLIYSVGAAGDTARNMVKGSERKRKTEYMQALRKQKHHVKAFMFSAAGNDVIGEDDNGDPVLLKILRAFDKDRDALGHINMAAFNEKINFLRMAYTKVISDIRSEPGFAQLPIFIHGYDYVFPYPWGGKANDPRKPKHAKKDAWLGSPLDDLNIKDREFAREIIKILIDKLYGLLNDIAGNPQQSNVWVVNCRNKMPNVSDWIDEIHGRSDGFEKIAAEFRSVMDPVLKPGGSV